MLLTGGRLTVALVTTHIPLRDVADCCLSKRRSSASVCCSQSSCADALGRTPRIAVAGLNPHAGESGAHRHGRDRRSLRPRSKSCSSACGRRCDGRRPVFTRHHFQSRRERRMGRRALHVSRSGIDPAEAARVRRRRERHARPAVSAHESRSRHRFRDRRQRNRAARQHDRRDATGGRARQQSDHAPPNTPPSSSSACRTPSFTAGIIFSARSSG